jgi:hypothetical protein
MKLKLTAQCQFLLHEIEKLKGTEAIKSLFQAIDPKNYFPQTLQTFVQKANNIKVFQLGPDKDEPYLKFNQHNFSLSHRAPKEGGDFEGEKSTFGECLRDTLKDIKIKSVKNKLLMNKLSQWKNSYDSCVNDKAFHNDFVSAVKENYGLEEDVPWPDYIDNQSCQATAFSKKEMDYFTPENLEDVVKTLFRYIQLPDKEIDLQEMTTDWRSLSVQLYLACIALTVGSDLGKEFEEKTQLQKDFANSVSKSLVEAGEFKSATLDFLKNNLSLEVSIEQRELIDLKFQSYFKQIEDHPNPDEFIVCENKVGGAFNFRGQIVMSFADFCDHLDYPLANLDTNQLQKEATDHNPPIQL